MEISVFDVAGPVMIGPSSSHTAGAARLSRVARAIYGRPFDRVDFYLHGSFARTYRGHGTDVALLAGALGIREDDERLRQAREMAEEGGLQWAFHEQDLGNVHANTVRIVFSKEGEVPFEVWGSSLGGGHILIHRIQDIQTEVTAQKPTLLIHHQDQKGVISQISTLLAQKDINIAVMKLSREGKGGLAACVIETDEGVDEAVLASLRAIEAVHLVTSIAAE